jgi:hypothetical protein
MEETQYRLNRPRDEMDYYLTVTPQLRYSAKHWTGSSRRSS